jgi:hypothetical protein
VQQLVDRVWTEKVHTSVTKVTCDVCTKLKIPSSNDGTKCVCKHPHRRHIKSHDVPCGTQFVSNHDVFIEGYVLIYCRIIVLAHHLRPRTAHSELRQTSNIIRNHKTTKLLRGQILAGVSDSSHHALAMLCANGLGWTVMQ